MRPVERVPHKALTQQVTDRVFAELLCESNDLGISFCWGLESSVLVHFLKTST